MKRPTEALIVLARTTRATAAAAVLLTATTSVAHAVSPVVTLAGRAWLTRVSTATGLVEGPARFHVTTSFSTDPPGAQLFTVQQAVIYFPDHAGTKATAATASRSTSGRSRPRTSTPRSTRRPDCPPS